MLPEVNPKFWHRNAMDAEKRKKVIQSIVLIHNFRTELVGLNQIATVFDPEYERYINLSGYDCIKRFYFNDED